MSSALNNVVGLYRKMFFLILLFIPLIFVDANNSGPKGLHCSTATKTAWLDIYLLIDTSANMGSTNLRQLSLSLTSEFSKYTIGQKINQTTRIALITYASQATVVSNLNTFNSNQDFNSALLGLKANDSDRDSNLYAAISQVLTMVETEIHMSSIIRPTVILVYGASSNDPNFFLVPSITRSIKLLSKNIEVITISYNQADKNLTETFSEMAPAYLNFVNIQTFYPDLEWALLQANCFCPDWQPYQLTYWDSSKNRPQKYAECIQGWMLDGGGDPNMQAPDLCDNPEDELVTITSVEKAEFIRLNVSLQKYDVPYFYIGLHRNSSNGPWSWYDFTQGEIPEDSYTQWLPGYSEKSVGNCVIANRTDANDPQSKYSWWTTTCFVFDTGLEMQWALCASRACDSGFVCHYGQDKDGEKKTTKKKAMSDK